MSRTLNDYVLSLRDEIANISVTQDPGEVLGTIRYVLTKLDERIEALEAAQATEEWPCEVP